MSTGHAPTGPNAGPGARRPTPVGRSRFLTLAAGLALAGCSGIRNPLARREPVRARLGITGGTQTLWRYLVVNDLRWLRPRGIVAQFSHFPAEEQLQSAYRTGAVDVIATLLPAVPALAETGVPIRFFLPIGWLREGYPIVAPAQGRVASVADLKAARLATYPPSHPGFACWRALLLANYGIRVESLNSIAGTNPYELLANGQADAAVVSSAEWAELRHAPELRKVSDLQAEWGRLTGSERLLIFAGYAARPEFLRANPSFLTAMVELHQNALRAFQSARAEFLSRISGAPAGLPGLTTEANAYIAHYLGYEDVPPERVRLSQNDLEDATRLFQLLAEAGYLRQGAPDAAALLLRP